MTSRPSTLAIQVSFFIDIFLSCFSPDYSNLEVVDQSRYGELLNYECASERNMQLHKLGYK